MRSSMVCVQRRDEQFPPMRRNAQACPPFSSDFLPPTIPILVREQHGKAHVARRPVKEHAALSRTPTALPISTPPFAVPPQQFQVLLTLSSGCFSIFAHATFALSVSPEYLALDGVYHPFHTEVPICATLKTKRQNWKRRASPSYGAITLSGVVFQPNLDGNVSLLRFLIIP